MTHFMAGNQIKLLRSGAEYFPALLIAIENARHDIYLQTYIFEPDITGKCIGHALMQAAKRGVSVKILLDGFGCKDLAKDYIQLLVGAGVQVMFYRPKISPWTFKKSRLRRLHRKVVVVDSIVGFVGGINIIDDNDVPNNMPPRIDYAVRIEGALLPAIAASAYKLWRRMAWANLQNTNTIDTQTAPHQSIPHLEKPSAIKPETWPTIKQGITAAFVLRDNLLHRRDIEAAYLEAIDHAQSEIIIANAYFVPGRRFRQALLAAAKRGVAVKLLLQGRMEYFLMFSTHAFYSVFLTNGIEIYEYRKGFMHSKVAVIDSFWATVGSSNIDPFSLLLAREANIIVQDSAFATELKTDISASINSSAHQVAAKDWTHGNQLKRLFSWLAYGLVRLFLGVIGYSNER